MAEQIEVVIDADGNASVEAKGVRGQGCAALTKAIEASLGTTTGDVKKPEFHQQAAAHEQRRATAGGGRA